MIPMTGDEAYFIFWARYPDYGYYDHTPMVAWILTAILSVSDAELWIRIPAILFSMLIAWVIYKLLGKSEDQNSKKVAIYAASIYLLIPVNLVAVLMTTDTPLIWWSFFSGVSYYQAQKQDSFSWYLICGIFLGLAFLSKFFSGLLAFAFLIHTVFYVRRGIKPYIGLLIVFIILLPFIFLNLLWNYNNCWNNYLFNLLNRTQGSSFSFKTTGIYFFMLVFIMPPGIYYLIRNKNTFKSLFSKKGREHTYLALFIIPIFLFGFLSFFKSIGLHWLFSFIPFLVLGLAKLLTVFQLEKSLKFMTIYAVIHVIIIGVILITAPALFQSNEKLYKTLVIGYYPDEMLNEVSKYKSDFIFATDSYALSAQLSYHAKEHIIVFGDGSYHARQDDLITDFRLLKGKDILIISEVEKLAAYSEFFESYEIRTMLIQGTELYYALGVNFKYEKYRETTLTRIRQRYYNIPEYLPQKACYMDERYANLN
ncbi:MAG: glycosyltransferase family 39 protein [Thiohalomonadales bacterium]